jgi:endoglucanase
MIHNQRISATVMMICLAIYGHAQSGAIRINQVGYYSEANKIAVVANINAGAFEVIRTADRQVCFTGTPSPAVYWADAGDTVRLCDFSALTDTGTYRIRIPGIGESYAFRISGTVLRKAAYASLKSYYYQRCSMELEAPFAGLWARAAGHPDTACLYHSATGKAGQLSSPGGWYDAGDYGKYVVNAGISVATLLSFHENFSDFFADSTLIIPESGNGQNDLLDEVKYELDWLKTMQDDGDGGVFHKLTTLDFIGFVMPEHASGTRYVMPKSTAATLDFAAMMAMAGRIYPDYDSAYAANCIDRALRAWDWAKAHPAVYYDNPPDVGTGEYGDGTVTDEFIWAAAELFITTGESEFRNYLEARTGSLNYNDAPGWPNVQPLASLSLATRDNGLDGSLLTSIRNSILSRAGTWLNQISSSPCRIPNFGYWWGSNSGIANIGVGLLYAYILSGDPKYIRGAAECADYLLGKNATGYSFQSAYGARTPMHFHHRPSGSDGIVQPVPGFVSGGPNRNREDNAHYPFTDPAKSYTDLLESYASNEICINWNSPLTALLAGVDAVMGDGSDVDFAVTTVENDPPVLSLDSPADGERLGSDEPFIQGSASDPDGIAKIELYLDTRFILAIDSSAFRWSVDTLSFADYKVTILAIDTTGLASGITHEFSFIPVGVIPGKMEAERYINMSGVSTEVTSDEGGGMDVTGIHQGDWIDYTVNIREEGDYRVDFRVAGPGGGQFELRRSTVFLVSSITFEDTGGPQQWITVSDTVFLTEGRKNLRLIALSGGWNINWMAFTRVDETSSAGTGTPVPGNELQVFPNPASGAFTVLYRVSKKGPVTLTLYDPAGRIVEQVTETDPVAPGGTFQWRTEGYAEGIYYLILSQAGKKLASTRLVKK